MQAIPAHIIVSFGWDGGAKKIPAWLNISTHPSTYVIVSRIYVPIPGRVTHEPTFGWAWNG
jgi:hypothetical protein